MPLRAHTTRRRFDNTNWYHACYILVAVPGPGPQKGKGLSPSGLRHIVGTKHLELE